MTNDAKPSGQITGPYTRIRELYRDSDAGELLHAASFVVKQTPAEAMRLTSAELADIRGVDQAGSNGEKS